MAFKINTSVSGTRKTRGFTIVELLIVIVVIGILAAIVIVAYNGVQKRARDTSRVADINAIQKVLELYRADNGVYPPTTVTSGGNGYSYSWATDGTWIKPLIDNGYLTKVPVPPVNDATHNYSYLHVNKNSYGCTEPSDFYLLVATGTDGTTTPSGTTSSFVCPSASWATSSTNWLFKKNE